MPDLGYTSQGASFAAGWENAIVGSDATASEDGTPTSMSAYLRETAGNNTHAVRLGVYASNEDFLGETAARQDITTTGGWYQFSDSSLPALVNSTLYYLVAFAGGGAGEVDIAYDTATGRGRKVLSATYPTWPDPAGFQAVAHNNLYSIYITYTAGGGATDLVIQDAAHAHAADNAALTQQHVLSIADAAHSHGADNIALTQAHVLAIADALHAHAADNLVLTQAHILTVQDATHAHAADNVALTTATILVVADAAHAHAADSLTLTQQHVLQIFEAAHAVASDVLALTQQHILVVSDALHAHAAENLALTIGAVVTPDGRVIIVPAHDRTILIVAHDRTIAIEAHDRTITIH